LPDILAFPKRARPERIKSRTGRKSRCPPAAPTKLAAVRVTSDALLPHAKAGEFQIVDVDAPAIVAVTKYDPLTQDWGSTGRLARVASFFHLPITP
jgi:hypothetical protein